MRRLLTAPLMAVVALLAPAGGVASPFEEPSIRTEHEISIGGKRLRYTAETGRIAIRDAETGEPRGQMFYIAYRVASNRPRPIAFVWNGGPGANSALLHFEAAGPKVWGQETRGQSKNSRSTTRREDAGEGVFTPTPAESDADQRIFGLTPSTGLTPNPDTWLTDMDLVFVDPIGTGFSRPSQAEYADEFYGTLGDVASVTEFVRAWRVVHGAQAQPVLLIGESWGAGRAGSVGYELEQRGIPVHALVLISGGTGLADNPVPASLRRALWVADLSTTALYHDRLPSDLTLPSEHPAKALREAAIAWAHRVYAPALERADELSDEDRQAVIEGLTRFTGIPPDAVEHETLRITPRAYRENLLGEGGPDLQLFDMRLTVPEDRPPLDDDRGARVAAITSYLRHTLGYHTSLPYVGLEPLEQGYAAGGDYPPSVGTRWNYATAELTPEETEAAIQEAIRTGAGPPRLGPPLPSAAEAVALNPSLKVWVAAGRFDSLNSCTANEELGRRLEGKLQAAYTFACYEGGHMMYRDQQARAQLAADIRRLASADD